MIEEATNKKVSMLNFSNIKINTTANFCWVIFPPIIYIHSEFFFNSASKLLFRNLCTEAKFIFIHSLRSRPVCPPKSERESLVYRKVRASTNS